MIQVPFPKPPTVSCILQHLTRKNTDIRENKNHCSAIFRHPDGPFVYWLNSSPTQKSNLHTFCVHLVFWACLPDVLTRAHLAQDPSTRHGARNAHQWLRWNRHWYVPDMASLVEISLAKVTQAKKKAEMGVTKATFSRRQLESKPLAQLLVRLLSPSTRPLPRTYGSSRWMGNAPGKILLPYSDMNESKTRPLVQLLACWTSRRGKTNERTQSMGLCQEPMALAVSVWKQHESSIKA